MGADIGGSSKVKNEPNVVPMIDIMLVLLIIFMIVTPVISSGFQARMPQGKNLESRPDEGGDVLLGLDAEGNFYLDPGTGKISPIDPVNVEDALRSVFQSRTTDKILYFKADADLEFARVQEAIQIARKAGVRVLAAVTEQQREGGLFGGRER